MKKLALVTGAGSGIGRATALELADKGYNVALIYYTSEDGAILTQEEILNKGVLANIYQCDVTNGYEVNRMAGLVKHDMGTPDVLVNCAGISISGLIQGFEEADWDELISTNLKSVFLVTKAFLSEMVSRKSGSIVNISSMWGTTGASYEVAYSASKGGVDAFTKALAKEVGPSGIRVNAVAPGCILTRMCEDYSARELRDIADESALLRNGEPEEIAKAVAFLASDDASFITGQILGANGGLVI